MSRRLQSETRCRTLKGPLPVSLAPGPDLIHILLDQGISFSWLSSEFPSLKTPLCFLTPGSGPVKCGLLVLLSDTQAYFVPVGCASTLGSGGVCGEGAAGVSSANENHLASCSGQMEARWGR